MSNVPLADIGREIGKDEVIDVYDREVRHRNGSLRCALFSMTNDPPADIGREIDK